MILESNNYSSSTHNSKWNFNWYALRLPTKDQGYVYTVHCTVSTLRVWRVVNTLYFIFIYIYSLFYIYTLQVRVKRFGIWGLKWYNTCTIVAKNHADILWRNKLKKKSNLKRFRRQCRYSHHLSGFSCFMQGPLARKSHTNSV